MSRRLLAVSLPTLALAAACSSGSPTAVATGTQLPSPPAVPTPTAAPTASADPTPTPTASSMRVDVVPTGTESPAALGQPTCRSADVTVTDADTVTPRGTTYRAEVYVLRTTGRACQLSGYPRVVVRGATVTPGGAGLPNEAPRPYTLTSATSLSFAVATPRAGAACDSRSSITVTLPGTTTPRTVVTDLRVCDARLGVSPVHRLGDDE